MAKSLFIISHWSVMIEGLDASPQDFFSAVEASVQEKHLPETTHSRVDWREGGILSAKREYLRFRRKKLAFDICGAPFGNGFFVSWWLGEIPSGILGFLYRIPILSWFAYLFEKWFVTDTYYKFDTAGMYQSMIHAAVLAVVDDFTKEKGLRVLGSDERKPQMRDFFEK